MGCCHQAALTWKRGRAVQLTLGNYLGPVNSVQPERAKGWRVSNRSSVSERRHRTSPGATSQSSAVPVSSSAMLISWDCSWVHSKASLQFPSPLNKVWPSASKFSPCLITIIQEAKTASGPYFITAPGPGFSLLPLSSFYPSALIQKEAGPWEVALGR